MEIITLSEYKTFAGISSPNQDLVLTPVISFVNQFITDYIGYAPTYTEFLENQNTILLPTTQQALAIGFEEFLDAALLPSVNVTGFVQVGFKILLPTTVYGRLIVTLATPYINTAIKEAANLLVKHYSKEEYTSQLQAGAEQVQIADPKSIPVHIKTILDLYRES